MALRVWLPLNGTLENKGISDITVTNNGATVDNNGKIGKCYYFNRSIPNYLKIDNPFQLSSINKFSMAFWIKISSNASGNNQIIHIGNGAGWNNNRFTCFIYQSSSSLVFSCGDGTDSSATHSTQYSCKSSSLVLNEWTHVACTYSTGVMKLYLNGVLNVEYTTSIIPSFANVPYIGIGAGPNAGEPATIYANDVRIYDHCLSPKEVKEISQGLVLHYKLDGWSGGAGENLVEGSNTNTTSTNKWFGYSAVGGNTSTIEQDETGVYCVKVMRDTTEQSSWDYLSYDNLLRNNIKTNTKYTISFDCKPSVTGSIGFTGFVNGSATNYMTNSTTVIQGNCIANQWNHMVYQCTTISSFDNITVGGQVVYFSRSTSLKGTNVTVLFKNIKVEEGSIETSWSPTSSEMGIDTTKITDSSGYGYDGIVTGTLTTESNSDRYSVSSYFNGSSYITLSNPWKSGSIVTEFTHTAWIKWDSNCPTSAGIHSIAGSNNFFRFSLGKSNKLWAYGLRSSLNGETTSAAGLGQYGSTTSLVNGQWYFISVTFKNGVCKCYCDGELVGTVDNSATYPALKSTIDNLYIGSYGAGGELAIGNVADSRMYCTALSAEDILDLYHTSANIDDQHNIHSFEFVEDDGNRVDEQGLVHSGLLSSDSDLIKLLYDKKLHIEPDGSVWAHIYHHNRPDLGSFSSTNDFANSVKINDNRWFNATEIVNSFSSEWEFLIIYNFTQGGTVYKERWIQTKNPETAVFGDVDAADITRVTGGEYKTGTWGGLYKKNGSAYWVMNNGTNGNWWGATGSFSIYQGGIPGYGGSITTTGCNDLYIRIDRFSSTPTQASIGRGSVYTFNDFIEK